MPLFSKDELEKIPVFEDLKSARKVPEKVIRLRLEKESAASLTQIAEFRNVQTLSLCLADVSRILPRLGELRDLQVLHLQACPILRFPQCLGQLRHLRELSIGNGGLEELPADIAEAAQLQALHLTQNHLTRLPAAIGQLAQLRTLAVSYNRLVEIPDSIGELQALEWLMLDVNQLAILPASIGRLGRLLGLTLNSNRLRTLPESICDLPTLERLSLEKNPLQSLPARFSQLVARLREFSIESSQRTLFMDWTYQSSPQPPRLELAELQLFLTPKSDLSAPLEALLAKSDLSPEVVPPILQLAREAIQIQSTVPDDYSACGCSRLGGFPDLADPALFPRTDGKFWIFLAQINLAEIAPLNSFLPRTGLLSFFLDSTECRNARVIFHEGDVRRLRTVRHVGAEETTDPQDDYTARPHRVRFARFASLPWSVPDFLESDEDHDAYQDCEELHESRDHHLNGYTFTQHESPQQQAADALRGKSEEWVPLLQLGFDDKVGFCFWDAGTLTFCVHQEDLRRADFSKIFLSLESS